MGKALKQVYWHFSTFKLTFNSRKYSGAKLASTHCPALAQRPQKQALMFVIQVVPLYHKYKAWEDVEEGPRPQF